MRIINIIYDQIIESFLKDLKASGLSLNSIRFYKSDIFSFVSWIKKELRNTGIFVDTFSDILPFVKTSFAESYKKYLQSSHSPSQTINRKLSAIRKFSLFLYSQEILPLDFAKNLQNIPGLKRNNNTRLGSITESFKKHLEENKASKNTIKNYLADINHFLNWLELKQCN